MSLSRSREFTPLQGKCEPQDEQQKLVLDHIPVALRAVKLAWAGDPEDLRQVALLALCRAARDWNGKGTFRGYAAQACKGAILNHVYRFVLRRFPRNTGRPARGYGANQELSLEDLEA